MLNPLTIVSEVVRNRQTWKVLADPAKGISFSSDTIVQQNSIVKQAILDAGMAPFHYDRGVDGVAEPWRVHFLDMATCRQIAVGLPRWFDLKPSNKLSAMLSACGCLVLVTWLPQFRGQLSPATEISADKKTEIDDEHLAASAALTQNLLTILTAAEMGTYWSSGGQLGSREMFERLGIDPLERLIAAVFVEYPGGSGEITERLPGKNRGLRSSADRWFSERTV